MKNRNTSSSQIQNKSTTKRQTRSKQSFDNSISAVNQISTNIPREQFRSFNKFSSMQQQDHEVSHVENLKEQQKKPNQHNKSVVQQNRPQTSQAVRRHNEYNNNEEDYSKSKKDELIKSLFKKRKEKMLSMETPKQMLTHHVSATTFDGVSYHHHNFSQFENPITDNLHNSSSISKILKDKKYKKFVNERTHTPPPQTVSGRIRNDKSNEKTMQTSSSFLSKKQTAYVQPKDPDETAYAPAANLAANQSGSKVQQLKSGNKFNININSFVKNNDNKNAQKPISDRKQQPTHNKDALSMHSSFSINSQANQSLHNRSIKNIQSFHLNQNINVKAQQPQQILKYKGVFSAHKNTITDLAIDPFHEGVVFSSSYDYSVKIWNLGQYSKQSFDLNFHSPFSNSSSGTSSGIMTPNSIICPTKTIENKQKNRMNALVYMTEQNILAAGGYDKQIKLYNLRENGELLITIKGGHQGIVNDMCRINEEQIATACSDHKIRIFSLLNNKNFNTPSLEFNQQNSAPNLITQLSQNTFLTSGLDRGVRIWDMRHQNPVLLFDKIHYDQINSIDKLSANIFATASDDSNLNVWDQRMEKLLKQIRFEDDKIGCIKFVKQSHLVASHSNALTVMSIRDNFTQKHTFYHSNDINYSMSSTMDQSNIVEFQVCIGDWSKILSMKAMAFSETDKKLYLGGSDNRIYIWDFHFNF